MNTYRKLHLHLALTASIVCAFPSHADVTFKITSHSRDVAVHYVGGHPRRTVHNGTSMSNIPFGSSFKAGGTNKDNYAIEMDIQGVTRYTSFVKGDYIYSVYAIVCNREATGCLQKSVNENNRVGVLWFGKSNGDKPIETPLNIKTYWYDSSVWNNAIINFPGGTGPEWWGVTFCTALRTKNALYRVDSAGCPSLPLLPTPDATCPAVEY